MYTPLAIKTNYSLLSSLIDIKKLVAYALKNNIKSLAITDNNLYGMMEFYKTCLANNIKPIIGLDITIENNHVYLYAKDYLGYKSLIKLSTIQTEREVNLTDIENNNTNLISIVPLEYNSMYSKISTIIPDTYISYKTNEEEQQARNITEHAVFLRLAIYIDESDAKYLRYLYCIRDGKTILDDFDYDFTDLYLDIDNIYNLSSNTGLIETNKISDMCNFSFPESKLLLPIFDETNGLSTHDYLTNLAKAGLNRRLDGKVPLKYLERLLYELDIINKMGFSNYFLVVYDFIKYAKKNKILVGPGRGSGAGSLVCFCLGITEIDPIKYDLLFERFLNPERISMPDIDTDFPDIYRDQVIDYVVNKYGKKRVSGIITFGTLAAKQAIRDVSRVLNIPTYQVELITKRIPGYTNQKLKDFYTNDIELKKIIDSDQKLVNMYKIACKVEGYPRHISSHAAGIIMCQKDLDEVIPLTKNNDIYLSGFPMEYLEELGLLKMDFLGLKTLTTIMHILNNIKENENIDIDFNKIPLDDKKVLELFSKADTTGIFQFESAGMKNFLRNLKPDSFEDIFAAIALFRPGPASNIDSYIRRKENKEAITYLDKVLEPILKPTKGIIIYQEQIIQIANIFAGYTLGEADILRRAMSKKKMDVLKNEEDKFIRKSVELGHDSKIAKQIFDLILNFANYGFNRSHSVAYSLIAYKMAYLKVYYPKYFYSSLLSSVIGSDIKTKEYISEAKTHNIKILKPDINYSGMNYIVEEEGIRFPLSAIKSIGNVSAANIINNRKDKYTDIFDFMIKTQGTTNIKVLESLIDSGCFDNFNYNRHTLITNLNSIINYGELVQDLDSEYVLKPELELVEEYSKDYIIAKEKEVFGFYLSNHPTTAYKDKYPNIISLDKLPDYFNKTVSFIVLVEKARVIKTKKNEDMMFFDGSDEYRKGEFTMFPKTYQKYRDLKVGNIIKVEGKVERRYNDFNIIVEKIEKL